MIELMIFVGLMTAAGYAMRRFGIARPELAADLSKVVFYFTLPPLIFLALRRADLTWSVLLMPAVAWLYLLGGVLFMLAITRLFRLSGPKGGALVIVAVFGNTTFLGYPIVQGFYGDEGLTLAIFYDLLGASIIVNTIAMLVASRLGGQDQVKGAQMLRRMLLFPPFWGLILGLGLRGIELPGALENVIEVMGSLTTPLIMLSIGLSLRFSAWREDLGLVALATFAKLIVFPVIVWAILSALALPPEMLRVAVLQVAMPTMFFSLTLALLFGLHKTLVVNTIMVSTLLSFLTLPAWRWLLGP